MQFACYGFYGEPGGCEGYVEGTRRNVREGEVAVIRGLGLLTGAAIIEREFHLGMRNGGSARVDHRAVDRSLLTERQRSYREQDHDLKKIAYGLCQEFHSKILMRRPLAFS